MEILSNYTREIVASGILLIIMILSRFIVSKLVRSFAKRSQTIEKRTKLVLKYIHLIINIIGVIALIIIWGVETKDIFVAFSTIATVVGVAFFAQWSIVSNVTSGIILFFSEPFKIGNTIRIHDNEFPIEAEIEDIGAFYVYLKTIDGKKIIYPNNLLLQKGVSIQKNPDLEVDCLEL